MWCIAGWLAATACSSDEDPGPAPTDGFLIGESGLPGAGGNAEGLACLGETREAEPVPLDMFVMLDISGSMLEALPSADPAAPRVTKWDSVRRSLEAFAESPETGGLGIGLQYFPQSNPGVPPSCASNAECGPGGPCTSSYCVVNGELEIDGDGAPPIAFVRIAGDTPRFCATDTDCPGAGESCRNLIGECVYPPGVIAQYPDGAFVNVSADPSPSVLFPLCGAPGDCEGLPSSACEEVGVCTLERLKCSASILCPPGAGECVPFPYSCLNETSCDVARYAAPAVPISSGPERAELVVESLARQIPLGETPTGPALTGALEHARAWAEQHPGRQVVAVLATDGFPTACSPLEISGIADVASGASSAPTPVRTFVIGVFGDDDLGSDGQRRLDSIARAGGTTRALIVNTAGDVTREVLDALTLVRDTAVTCEFSLTNPVGLNFDQVNLDVAYPDGSTRALFNVGDVSACGDDQQGWYYVRDPGGNPYQINVCPSTCAGFGDDGVQATLQIGCATRIR
ncbi:MAG TPA: hypothetical protein VNN80_01710 [Polyangiaceae bacterium]|nr:hypothetical protein [Polyangiaceae bacterium]